MAEFYRLGPKIADYGYFKAYLALTLKFMTQNFMATQVQAMLDDKRDDAVQIKHCPIMVVDDNLSNLTLLRKLLQSDGYSDITLVSDPFQFMPMYRSDNPDLILLDIKMPGMDGFQIMDLINTEPQQALKPPIIVLTAQNDKEYLLRALNLGATDFLGKPFDRTELLLRVRNVLESQWHKKLLCDQKALLENEVQLRTFELNQTRLAVVQRLGMAAEYKDEETGNHILRMSAICALLARKLQWPEDRVDLILHASPMHDIGKIGIPDAILLKPGKLTPQQWQIMKTHAQIGAELLSGDTSDLMLMAKDIACHHHEKYDGTGYPGGLSGEDIPIAARVAAVADVFDALTSKRPYKEAWSFESAVSYIVENSGKHFDPQLVELFCACLDEVQQIQQNFAD